MRETGPKGIKCYFSQHLSVDGPGDLAGTRGLSVSPGEADTRGDGAADFRPRGELQTRGALGRGRLRGPRQAGGLASAPGTIWLPPHGCVSR